ncbi:MAG: DUF4974 domain-containing protein [Planctomycetota bacterium]
MTRSRRGTCRFTFICLMLAAVPGPSLWGEEPDTRTDVGFTDAQPRQATLDALASPVEFEFFDTPLSDVAAELSDIYSIDILIDNVALEPLGLDASEPITATVNGISLRSGLASILGALELVAIPVPLGIRITSEEEATATLVHAIYPIDDLLQGPRALTQEELIEAILTSLSPDTWDQVGGDGGLRFFRGNLIVVQSWDVHQQLRDLLHALRSTRNGPFDSEVDASINAERDRQLQQTMKARIDVDFFDLPLGDAMQELTEQLQLPIHIDAVSLEMLGLDSSEPITLSLKDQPAGEVLGLMLRPLELDWITRNEAIWIVSEETATADMTCRLYPIERFKNSADELQATLVDIVAPDSWTDRGGEGSLVSLADATILLVRQTDKVHQKIDSLLEGLTQLGTSFDEAPAEQITTEIYRIRQHPDDAALPIQHLQFLIRQHVRPEVWTHEPGFPPSPHIVSYPGRLIIKASSGTHREVRDFIERLGLTILPPYASASEGP